MAELAEAPMQLASRTWGKGPRSAVFAHCSLAHSGAWSGVAHDLADLFTMTAVDLPSHGRSPDWHETDGDYHDVATAALRSTVLAVGQGAPVDLAGHSLGGTLVLRLALESPELVRSLTLVEPVIFAAVTGGQGIAEDNRPFFDAWETGDRAHAAEVFMDIWGAGLPWTSLPERQRRYIMDRIGVIPATDPALSADRAGLLRPGRLEGLNRPALLIHGGASAPLAPTILRKLAERMPDAELLSVDGARHMVPISHPRIVAAAMRRLAARS